MSGKSGTEAVLTDEEKVGLDRTGYVTLCPGAEGEAAEREKDARYQRLVDAGVLVRCSDSQTPGVEVYHYPDPYCSWCGKKYFPRFNTVVKWTVLPDAPGASS